MRTKIKQFLHKNLSYEHLLFHLGMDRVLKDDEFIKLKRRKHGYYFYNNVGNKIMLFILQAWSIDPIFD